MNQIPNLFCFCNYTVGSMLKTIPKICQIPRWVRNETVPGNLYQYTKNYNNKISIYVNREKQSVEINKGYVSINRTWKEDDVITIDFPIQVKQVKTNPLVEENQNKVAFEYDPLVYCAEEADNNMVFETSDPANIDFKVNQ